MIWFTIGTAKKFGVAFFGLQFNHCTPHLQGIEIRDQGKDLLVKKNQILSSAGYVCTSANGWVGCAWLFVWGQRKIRLIEGNAKCRYLKNWPVKGLCGRCFICLRPPPLPWPHIPPPLHTVYVYAVYLFTQEKGGGELTSEKVRGAIVAQSRSKIPTWLTVSPVYKLY